MAQRTDSNLIPRDDDIDFPIPDDLPCLGEVEVVSFTADPPTVEPFGGPATLSWNVRVPTGCNAGLHLNGRPVRTSGSMQVQPTVTTRYSLSARLGPASRFLDDLTLRVDTSACISSTIAESNIRGDVRAAVAGAVAENEQLSQRSEPRVEVDAGGIHLGLRFKLAIDNFVDPSIDVDATVGLRLRDGAVDVSYRSFAVDVDWPWWVTALTAGVTKIIEEFMDDTVEDRLKPMLLEKVKQRIDDRVAEIPGFLRLHRLGLAENEISVTVCPAGDTTPAVVLATDDTVEAHVLR